MPCCRLGKKIFFFALGQTYSFSVPPLDARQLRQHGMFNKLCAWQHNMPPPPASCQYPHLFASWHLFRHVGYLRHQQQVDLSPFDLESGVRVTCDVGYLSANFSLPRPLCSRVKPEVCDRQTDVRQTVVRRHTSNNSIA